MASPRTLPAARTRLAPLAEWASRHVLALTCLAGFALALVLRLYRLDAQSLWLDEGGTWAEVTGRGWGALLADLINPDAAYPLYHLLLKGWIALAGDSVWALRFPSALAGALAVVALVLAADEVGRDQRLEARGLRLGVGGGGDEQGGQLKTQNSTLRTAAAAALLAACSPFAIWHAQDAKVYSMLIAVLALLVWALLRALRRRTPAGWVLLAALVVAALCTHRLAVLAVAGVSLAVAWGLGSTAQPGRRGMGLRLALVLLAIGCGVAGLYGLTRAAGGGSWQETGHIPAGPLTGLWLTFAHFSLDRGDIGGLLGLPLILWALPCAALTLWGLALLLGNARRDPAAVALLCMLVVPLGLFLLALLRAPIFEARYAAVAFPAWLLVLAYPFGQTQPGRQVLAAGRWAVGLGLLLVNALVLLQPHYGLFSGAPVKEQWRDAIEALARQLHPDDLLILHPYYAMPLWDYYAPRVTPDPLPRPVVFTDFSQGFCAQQYQTPRQIRDCFRRGNEQQFLEKAVGRKRALLLIAPEHAATIDRPKTLEELRAEWQPGEPEPTAPDQYGWIGLRFQYPQRTWPCGGAVFVGVEIKCQSYPSAFGQSGPASIPQPATRLEAVFGGELRLRGYTITPPGGALRSGGVLPITLYWEAASPPAQNYSMFLHLCQDCTQPPLAQSDLPPLNGYPPAGLTTDWAVGDPLHDERAVPLRDSFGAPLPPGRYTLLLGVYPLGNPAIDARLPVVSAVPTPGGTRVVLGEVEIK
ncbi:MAG: glycosyltransferase family 39 protein [Roseiflexaceae bacterium]